MHIGLLGATGPAGTALAARPASVGHEVPISDLCFRIPGMRPLDAGELSNATAIEAFTAALLQLNVRYQTRVALQLAGIDDDPRAQQ